MFLLVERILSICSEFTDNIAVNFCRLNGELKCVSYRQLIDSSGTIKQALLECFTNFKVSKRRCIGILLDPQYSFPAIILGILMCESPFVCLDVAWPKQLAESLVNVLNVDIIITHEEFSHLLQSFPTGQRFSHLKSCKIIDDDIQIWCSEDKRKNENGCGSEHRLSDGEYKYMYAIQTSGSTGKPKIVRVPEECILPNILHLREIFKITSADGIYFSSPVTFDPSLIELFLSMTSGATLYIVPNKSKAAVDDVLKVIFGNEKKSVTFIQTTPSLFLSWPKQFVLENVLNDDTRLRILALGGECCPSWDVIKRYRSERNETKIFNLYGVTEVSCWASIRLLTREDDGSDLGDPLSETILQVRGTDGKEITDGVGEMFIGSASRYCLIDDESVISLKLPIFRPTGDIVKVQDRKYSFFGRRDCVIKRWGHRVCLSEIERIAALYKFVKWSSCSFDKKYGLILFVLLSDYNEPDGRSHLNNLRAYLKANLNPASVPDRIVRTDRTYLSAHGKVNHKLLESLLNKEVVDESFFILQKDVSFRFKYKEMWRTYTNKKLTDRLNSNNPLPISSSTDGIQNSDTNNAGFLSAGGDSISAIQFVSQLSQFVLVPGIFLGKLLCDCSFEDSLQILMENRDECRSSPTVSNLVDNDFTDGRNDSVNEEPKCSSSFVGAGLCKPAVIKKQKLDESIYSYCVVSSKCRGQTVRCNHDKNELEKRKVPSSAIHKINLESVWKYNLGKCVDASPTVIAFESGAPLVLVGSHSGQFIVINIDGEVISQCTLPDRIESSALVSRCGSHYYVGCYDGKLYCIAVRSGAIIWSFQTSDVIKSTPIFSTDSTLVFGSYDKNIYCLSADTGKLIWCYEGTASFLSVPCITTCRKLFTASLDGLCVALASDTGHLLWSYRLDSPVFASPVAYEHDIVFAQVTGVVWCFNIDSGNLLWKFYAGGNIFSSLTYCGNTNTKLILFGCYDCHIYCLSVSDGSDPKIVWKTHLESPIFSTPFISTEIEPSILAVCSTKGIIQILDLYHGYDLATFSLEKEIFSSPVIEGDCVIFGCRDDNVYCFRLVIDC